MTPFDYLKQKMEMLTLKFPRIRCAYEKDDTFECSSHSIEIRPRDIYYNNQAFSDLEVQICEEFFNLYPDESFFFVPDDALFPIEKPTYIVEGNRYIH